MTRTLRFRPTGEDLRIIAATAQQGEDADDVIRRALRLLERETWSSVARADAARLAGEDLSEEDGAW